MVDRVKDKDELALEALFSSDPIADDGFSRRIMARVRRRIWIKRLTLPTAMTLGALFAFKPLVQIIAMLGGVVGSMPVDRLAVSAESIPSVSTFFVGACVIVAAMFFLPALEE